MLTNVRVVSYLLVAVLFLTMIVFDRSVLNISYVLILSVYYALRSNK